MDHSVKRHSSAVRSKFAERNRGQCGLSRHQDLVEEIKALGDDITVEVGKPCPDDENRGLVIVSYGSRSEHDAISDLLSRRDGFGVPVHLVKR